MENRWIGRLFEGKTVSGAEAAAFIANIQDHLPGCVQQVLVDAIPSAKFKTNYAYFCLNIKETSILF